MNHKNDSSHPQNVHQEIKFKYQLAHFNIIYELYTTVYNLLQTMQKSYYWQWNKPVGISIYLCNDQMVTMILFSMFMYKKEDKIQQNFNWIANWRLTFPILWTTYPILNLQPAPTTPTPVLGFILKKPQPVAVMEAKSNLIILTRN